MGVKMENKKLEYKESISNFSSNFCVMPRANSFSKNSQINPHNYSNCSIDTSYIKSDSYGINFSNETNYSAAIGIHTDYLHTTDYLPTTDGSGDFEQKNYMRDLYLNGIQKKKAFRNTYIKRAQFYKTKVCLWHLNGRCFMGEDCNYAHSFSELKENPDLRKTTLCTELKKKLTCTNPACPYAHSQKELRANNFLFKTSVCKFWKYGRCPAGSNCRYAHGFEEVRNPLEGFNEQKYDFVTMSNSCLETKTNSPKFNSARSLQESNIHDLWNKNNMIFRASLQSTDIESDIYSRIH